MLPVKVKGKEKPVRLFAVVNLKNSDVLKRLEEETNRALLAVQKDLEFIEFCKTGSLEQIYDAIKKGANVNARIENERTPLMMAAWKRTDPKMIRALIKLGADVHMRDDHGYTPLMFAADFNSNPEISEALIIAGADVNVNAAGFTPLMAAAFSNVNPEVITVLLKLGADPKLKNIHDKDNMAIDYARRNRNLNNTETLKRLEEISR
jgi:ankyrin repeat protein